MLKKKLEEDKLNEVKQYLLYNKYLNVNEIKTLEHVKQNKCNLCNKICGNIARLSECDKKIILCLNCIDDLYDSYNIFKNKIDDILFPCICCNKSIYNYEII